MKKKEKVVISHKHPHFVSFCNTFGFSSKKDSVISQYDTGYSTIQDLIAEPFHIQLIATLIPKLPLSKLSEVSGKIVSASTSFYLQEEPDYYETTYPSFTFTIPVTEVYEIYMKYQEYV